MSVVNCPNCDRRVSSRAKACPFCNFDLLDADSGLDAQEAKRRLYRKRSYQLQMHTYAAVTLTVLAFAWFWYETYLRDRPAPELCVMLLAGGVIWYLGARAVMLWLRFARK